MLFQALLLDHHAAQKASSQDNSATTQVNHNVGETGALNLPIAPTSSGMPDFTNAPPTDKSRPTSYHSLPTGARFCEGETSRGDGVLKVDNGTSEDAALRLFDTATGKVVRCLFVKAHDSARLQSIPEGHYSLRFSTGLDWQDSEQSFQWDPTYSEFERELDYLEIKRGDETEYHEISVTLHAVPGGTVRTHKISKKKFLGMSGS